MESNKRKMTKKKKKKKMNLSSIFKGSGTLLAIPLCHNNEKTHSFRDMIKTVNSVFSDDVSQLETPESWFTNSSETTSYSTESDDESIEMVVRGVVRSERLFFDPGVTSSILDESDSKSKKVVTVEEISVAVEMESEDPYGDFRRSMEEMVKSYGDLAKDWESLESMLAWYLGKNGRESHGVIVSAFVDVLAGISDSGAGTSSDSGRYSTAVSSLPSSPLCSVSKSLTEIEEEERRSC